MLKIHCSITKLYNLEKYIIFNFSIFFQNEIILCMSDYCFRWRVKYSHYQAFTDADSRLWTVQSFTVYRGLVTSTKHKIFIFYSAGKIFFEFIPKAIISVWVSSGLFKNSASNMQRKISNHLSKENFINVWMKPSMIQNSNWRRVRIWNWGSI